ncbi:hypothetical protein ACS0TY_007140 [Phlomoides rotata]
MKSWHTARILMTSFPTSQCLNEILIRLADCVACYGSATPEVNLTFQILTIAKLQDVKLVLIIELVE